MNKIKSTHLILLQAVLFVIFLLVTSWFNRFTADDYHFIGELNSKSFQEIYAQLYFHWHGRWSSNFLLLAFLELRNIPHFLFVYFIFSYSFLLLGISSLLKQINNKIQLQLTQKQIVLYSFITIGVLFFCTINPNETWFWYTSSVVYFWSIIAFFFGASSFIKTKKTILDYLIILICLLYIGGSNEPLTAFIGLILFYQTIRKKKKLVAILSLIVLSTAFLINYLSKGTLNRDEITPSLGILDWILYIGFGSIKHLFFSIYKAYLPVILFALPFYYLGKQSDFKTVNFNPKKQLLYSLLGAVVLVVLNQLIVITALGGLSPDRAMIGSSVFIMMLFIRYAFLLGNHQKELSFQTRPFIIFNVIALLIFNVSYFRVHQHFSYKYDERIDKITQPTTQKVIEVIPLPFSGYIYNPELKENSDYFVNQHLKSGLGIDSELILKEK